MDLSTHALTPEDQVIEVKDSRIVHTIIKSDRRFTYEEAQKGFALIMNNVLGRENQIIGINSK